MALFKGHQTRYHKSANSSGNNTRQKFINIGCSCESLRVKFECFAFGKLISIYMMINPLSHRCKNFTEPGLLRGDLDNNLFQTVQGECSLNERQPNSPEHEDRSG